MLLRACAERHVVARLAGAPPRGRTTRGHRSRRLGRRAARQRGRLTSFLTIALLATSCGSDGTSATDREADIYATLIRALAPSAPTGQVPGDEPDELDRVVFAGSLDEEEVISLEVQAAVVEQLEEFATVRFVDERGEAIDDSSDRARVLDDGVLVLVGPVPSGRTPSVDVERYVDDDHAVHVRVTIERLDGGWEVATIDTVP